MFSASCSRSVLFQFRFTSYRPLRSPALTASLRLVRLILFCIWMLPHRAGHVQLGGSDSRASACLCCLDLFSMEAEGGCELRRMTQHSVSVKEAGKIGQR